MLLPSHRRKRATCEGMGTSPLRTTFDREWGGERGELNKGLFFGGFDLRRGEVKGNFSFLGEAFFFSAQRRGGGRGRGLHFWGEV